MKPNQRSGAIRYFVSSSIAVGVSILSVGAVSFLLIAVGARAVPDNEMAGFVREWVIINTVVVALGSAFDQLGPRILAHWPELARTLLLHATVLPLAGSLLAAVATAVLAPSSTSPVSLLLYSLGVSLWAGGRSLQLSAARFMPLAQAALAMLSAAVAALTLFMALGLSSADTLFFSAAIGNICGWYVGRRILIEGGQPRRALNRLPAGEYSVAASVVISSASLLAISSGGLVLAGAWGVSASRVVAYAGLLNLIRIPFLMLSSVTGPVNVEIASRIADADVDGALRLVIRMVAVTVAGAFLIAAGLAVGGPQLLELFIGGQYDFEIDLGLSVVIVESCLWFGSVVRTLSVSMARSGLLIMPWLAGTAGFLLVAIQGVLGASRLVVAPIVGAAIIATFSAIWLAQIRHVKAA